MSDEYIKIKYGELYNKLKKIKEELELLKDDYNDLYGLTKKGILIDDKVIEEDTFLTISSNQEQVLYDLVNVLIPIVTSKM